MANNLLIDKDSIYLDVLNLYDGDIWNVIFSITNEYGIEKLPTNLTAQEFVNTLTNLRYETAMQQGGN
jgi:hypothetical protein